MKDGEHIAIENSPGIGDLIVLTPILRKIKEKYPHSVLTVISRKRSSLEAVKRIPYIDYVHFMDGSLKGRIKTFLMLRHQDYLLLNSYQGAVVRLAKLAGVKHRTGNCKEKYKNTNLFTHPLPYTNDASMNQYIIDFLLLRVNLALDENFIVKDYQCDVSLPTQIEINVVKEKMRHCNWAEEKFILFCPTGTSTIKLKMHTILCCISTLISSEKTVVLTGLKNEELEKVLSKNFPETKRIINLMGKTSMNEMIALISLADRVVTPNSGPMHISVALKRPTIGIFTSGNRLEWQPKRYCEAIGLDLSCSKHCIEKSKTCKHECIDFPDDFVKKELEKWLES